MPDNQGVGAIEAGSLGNGNISASLIPFFYQKETQGERERDRDRDREKTKLPSWRTIITKPTPHLPLLYPRHLSASTFPSSQLLPDAGRSSPLASILQLVSPYSL